MAVALKQPPVRPPALLEATVKSTSTWQNDLNTLFHRAKDRFPDVVWDLVDEDAMDEGDGQDSEVWGHKAIVYARAPPSFQARYFSFRPAPISSPLPYGTSPTPSLPVQTTSALSLNADFGYAQSVRSVSPSQSRSFSPAPSAIGSVTRITLSHNPALFSNELEYLYTGRGFGDAFEFLFDANEKGQEGDLDVEEARIDKLRKDLVYMWRSRLYSDVRIELHGDMPDINAPANEEETRAIFCSHRFILVSRCPYFYDQLITYGLKNTPAPGEPATVRVPSPPFTPPALHFILGYLYTGTLSFSNRTYDLDTGFAILVSSNYLQLQTLYDEVQARLVQEMLHGLFHAFLEFSEYERITGGRWGTGGCRCRQCARRAPRTLTFAMRPDVQNQYLDRGARRALVGLFGEGWCTPEFAQLPQKTKDGLMTGLKKRVVPQNVFPLLFAAHAAIQKLNNVRDAWGPSVRDMVMTARGFVDTCLANEAEQCFREHEWVDLMNNDGQGRFEDGERVDWVMESVRRGWSESNAGTVYQALVSCILLRPHPTEPNETLLSNTSHIRVQVEQTRIDLLRWMTRRWIQIRLEKGFDSMESWALKEISDEISVPVEDLLSQSTNAATLRGPLTRTGLRPTLSRVEDRTERDTMSITPSLRASVLSKTMGVRGPPGSSGRLNSSGASMRSVARSVAGSTTSRVSSRLTTASERERKESRPDSKFAPSSSRSGTPSVHRAPSVLSNASAADDDVADNALNTSNTSMSSSVASQPRTPRKVSAVKDTSDAASVKSVSQRSALNVQRPRSVASVRSHASTIRRNAGTTNKATLRPPQDRPSSSLSNVSMSSSRSGASNVSSTSKKASATRDTASSRARRASATSTASVRSAARPVAPAFSKSRPRRSSDASTKSTASNMAMRAVKASASKGGERSGTKTPTLRKSPSVGSMKSTTSVATAGRKMKDEATGEKKALAQKAAVQRSRSTKTLPKVPSKENIASELPNTSSNMTIKAKGTRPKDLISHKSLHSSDAGSSTTRGTPRRRESNDTITLAKTPTNQETAQPQQQQFQPRGATLDIGIQCIVSSKRKRFRAFARYIGEVEGETGPWVGVEVPVSDNWADESLDGAGRQWHDGSWGGIKYFEVGSAQSEWGEDDRMTSSRRRRVDTSGSYASSAWKGTGTKREGDQLSVSRQKRFRSTSPSVSDMSTAEYRGLFVRPQQVLYVVDAVGSDL